MVCYLFPFYSSVVNKSYAHLSVKHAPSPAEAQARLLLFSAARSAMGAGLRVLGLEPLENM